MCTPPGLVIYETITGMPVDDFPILGGHAGRIRMTQLLLRCFGWSCTPASVSPSSGRPTRGRCSRSWPHRTKGLADRPGGVCSRPMCGHRACRGGMGSLDVRSPAWGFMRCEFCNQAVRGENLSRRRCACAIPKEMLIPRPAPSAIFVRVPAAWGSSVRVGRDGMPARTTLHGHSKSSAVVPNLVLSCARKRRTQRYLIGRAFRWLACFISTRFPLSRSSWPKKSVCEQKAQLGEIRRGFATPMKTAEDIFPRRFFADRLTAVLASLESMLRV